MKESKIDFKVCVRCFTFNQSRYIEDAMNGFTKQETDFPFVCCIVDDASTDDEQEVIKKYLQENFELEDYSAAKDNEDYQLLFARHKKNHNCYFAVLLLKYNHYCIKKKKLQYIKEWDDKAEFIATCEGDDYWVDALKLQKQVDLMEQDHNVSMIHSRFDYLQEKDSVFISDESENKVICSLYNADRKTIAYNILEDNSYRIQTVTVLIRNEYNKIAQRDLEQENGLFMMGDTQLWLRLLKLGEIKYAPEKTSIYRLCENSASHSEDVCKHLKFELSCEEMRFYYSKLLDIKPLHFFYRYLKILIKYRLYKPDYKTNPIIVGKGWYKALTCLVDIIPFQLLSFLKNYI